MVEVPAGGAPPSLRIQLVGQGTVRGRLIDKRTNAPALGLEVLVEGSHPVDAEGRFEFRLCAGTHSQVPTQSSTRGNSITTAIALRRRRGRGR